MLPNFWACWIFFLCHSPFSCIISVFLLWFLVSVYTPSPSFEVLLCSSKFTATPSHQPHKMLEPIEKPKHHWEPTEVSYSTYSWVRLLSPLKSSLDKEEIPLFCSSLQKEKQINICIFFLYQKKERFKRASKCYNINNICFTFSVYTHVFCHQCCVFLLCITNSMDKYSYIRCLTINHISLWCILFLMP